MLRNWIILLGLLAVGLSDGFAGEMTTFRNESAGGSDGLGWVIAEGRIVQDTPRKFERFVLENHLSGSGTPVYLSSRGGDLQAGIALGRLIRRFGMATVVSGSAPMDEMPEGFALPETTGAYCASACSYAFLGGISRSAPDKTVGLHQFFFSQARDEPTSIRYSGADLSNNQVTMASLLEYVMEMGVDGRFLVAASRTPPKEMKWLTTAEMADFKVLWDDQKFGPWQLEAYKGGVVAVSKTSNSASVLTLFCRRKPPIRMLISSPTWLDGDSAAYLAENLTSLFGSQYTIDAESVKVSIADRKATIEFALPEMQGIEEGLQSIAAEIAESREQPISSNIGFIDTFGPGPRAIFWYEMPIKHFERSLRIVGRNCF